MLLGSSRVVLSLQHPAQNRVASSRPALPHGGRPLVKKSSRPSLVAAAAAAAVKKSAPARSEIFNDDPENNVSDYIYEKARGMGKSS